MSPFSLDTMDYCKKSHPIEIIGCYRSTLMGIAILWIVLLHTLVFKPSLSGNLLTFIKSIGYFSIDIFLFLSGFGLITGWVNKQYTITAFYKRRLLRIMPAYWVVLSGGLLGKILLGQEYRVSIAEFFCFGNLFHFKPKLSDSFFSPKKCIRKWSLMQFSKPSNIFF